MAALRRRGGSQDQAEPIIRLHLTEGVLRSRLSALKRSSLRMRNEEFGYWTQTQIEVQLSETGHAVTPAGGRDACMGSRAPCCNKWLR